MILKVSSPCKIVGISSKKLSTGIFDFGNVREVSGVGIAETNDYYITFNLLLYMSRPDKLV